MNTELGPLAPRALRPSGEQVGEGVADQGGHLPDQAAAAGGQLEPVEEDRQVQGVGQVAAERLGQRGLAAADVAGEHEQRRPVGEQRQGGQAASRGARLPTRAAAGGVGEQVGLAAEPVLDVIEADEPAVPVGADRLGQLDDGMEQVLDGAHRLLDPERDEHVAGHPGAVAPVAVAGLAGPEPGHRFVGSDAVDGQGVTDRGLLRRRQGVEGRAVGEVAVEGVPGDGRAGGERAGAVVEEVAARGGGVAQPQLPRVRGRVPEPVVDRAEVAVAQQQRGFLGEIGDAGQAGWPYRLFRSRRSAPIFAPT